MNVSARSLLTRWPRAARHSLAASLAAVGLAFLMVLLMALLQVSAPGSLLPDTPQLERVFYGPGKPISNVERVIESTTGELEDGESMRPAFFERSLGWDELVVNRSVDEMSKLYGEREAERLALLDWVRAGASRESYDSDEHRLTDPAAAQHITPKYLAGGGEADSQPASSPVRIRTLITDRCVTCHSDEGSHEKARWVPLDTFDQLAPQCRPVAVPIARPAWLIAFLAAILPLAAIAAPLFYATGQPLNLRVALPLLTSAAVATMVVCWLFGRPGGYYAQLLIAAALAAAILVLVQIVAACGELLAKD